MFTSTFKHAFLLAGFAIACAGMIVAAQIQTRERIQLEQDRAFARMLSEVLPIESYDNNIAQDCVLLADEDLFLIKRPIKIYRASNQDKHAAVVIETIAPDGYSGEIAMLTGIYANGTIAGVRVTSHKETPGLGDKIETNKSPWITQFTGLSLRNPEEKKWAVKKDGGTFDAFAGATVTPRAVIAALKRVQQYYTQNRSLILSAPNQCGVEP